jgi:hypothetical protein
MIGLGMGIGEPIPAHRGFLAPVFLQQVQRHSAAGALGALPLLRARSSVRP